MEFEFKFPDVGEGIHEGKLLKWKVNLGDSVNHDQVLCEIETDKAVVEIPSPKKGKILKLLGKEGEMIKVGNVLVVFDVEGEATPTQVTSESNPAPKNEADKAGSVVGFLEEAKTTTHKAFALSDDNSSTQTTVKRNSNVIATLGVKKLAKDLGVDLEKITGTGAGGRITEDDVKKASNPSFAKISSENDNNSTSQKEYDFYGKTEDLPLSSIRKSIAHKMQESVYTAPHVTVMDDCDVTKLTEKREVEKKNAELNGIKLTPLSYVVKAIVLALKLHPLLNSTFDDKNEKIILKKYYNIGIAVDTTDGLLVPVIKNADTLSVFEIAKEIMKYSELAKTRKIGLSDLKGGSFSITNIGSLGGIYFTPVINFPEVAILGIGRMQEKAKFADGNFTPVKIMPLSLSFDHRVVDGAEAARFMKDLMQLLENPEKLN